MTSLKQAQGKELKNVNVKHPDDYVEVQVLETCEEQGILDPDDVVADVLDDKEKVIAVFQEQSLNRPYHNGGDGMSTSSIGTASPDIFQAEISSINNDSKMRSISPEKDENQNITSKLIVVSSAQIREKPQPPPVAPKPNISRTKEPSVPTVDSDSGIYVTSSRTCFGSDSSKSEVSEPISTPRVMRMSETAFVAIGTPIIAPNKPFNFNVSNNNNTRNTSTSDFEQMDDDEEDGQFSLGRNSARQSMFIDHPALDRWAEFQEKRMYEERENSQGFVSADEREEPAGASMSPTDDITFDNNMFSNECLDKQDGVSNNSFYSGDSDESLAIELHPQTSGDLGFTVAGYKTADGRELGLIVRNISPDGCAARDGKLQIADRIVEINGSNLQNLSNKRAEEIFSESIKVPVVKLVVSGSSTFVHEERISKDDTEEDKNTVQEVTVAEQVLEQETLPAQYSVSPEPNSGIEPPPGFRDDRKAQMNGPQLSSNVKKVNKKILLELNKGSDGLGFSITTRDNPAGGHTPIFVKSILAKGAAIEDGQLKSGDQILEVNGTKMTGKSQGEAVNILRSTRGLVKLLIQREELIQSATKPAIQVNEESTRNLREQGKQVLTFKIPLNYTGAAGLGVSVKGKVDELEDGRDSPQDKGIFVKSVIAGGAAQKDGRLQADDQLLSVNNVSFLGVPNSEAIDRLRTSMQSTRLGQAFIEVTIARDKDDDGKDMVDFHQPEQERPIEAGSPSPVVTKSVPVVQQNISYQNVPQVPRTSLDQGSLDDDDEDDEFSEEPVALNFSVAKSRNIVQRNESYCFAVTKSKQPYRRSPLITREPARSSGALRTSMSGNIPNRPSSTVAMPTPPLGSTQDRSAVNDGPDSQSNVSKVSNPTPVPPPRVDSYNSSVIANYQIHQQMANGRYSKLNANTSQDQGTIPPAVPQPPLLIANEKEKLLSAYPKGYERTRSSESETMDNEVFNDSKDVVFAGSELPDDNPFDREGFGRQSMSEKRARASMDAKKTEIYQKRERQKLAEEKQKPTKTRPSSSYENMNCEGTPSPLRKAKSEGHMQAAAIDAQVSRKTSSSSPMLISTSDSSLRPGVNGKTRTSSGSTSNLSFRNAIEGASTSSLGRDMPNGVARQSQSDDAQDEIPITMTSKADFNAVQQKLAKKPFYRKFKIGKTRRGEYNISDIERSPKHSIYSQEALIDFPSEQRYRQLVSHYDESDNRPNSMPSRGRKSGKDQNDGKRLSNQPSSNKIGRVIMSEPTQV
ncbi:partitioning defective 3 homolog isoform X2 [Actinia tenebrosa]|uniref:Partitioning defective 3 homolog isoform X2 n=1 Tax=Actinia tenebrosa TaxID=6105 RepID=A0A6P8HBP8_ACTTE|nr:partitioning defective 3 homolog isoform X2 [Actinia tenebrosa]